MFEVLIVKPLFNLLVLIYTILPGHNFGLALVLFTILIRFLMWPLIKKQLHHASAMRKLQPELKRIKQAAKGNRQKESMMVMELYKERELSPFGALPVLIIQFIVLIGLYSGLNKLIRDPQAVVDFTYPFLQNTAWLKDLSANIGQFDATFLGFVDLTKAAIQTNGGLYWPAMIIVLGSAVTQYFQSKQLMPNDKDSRTLRQILREASSGKQADQSEVSAAVGRSTRFFIPALIFIFTVNLPSALGLYWFVSGLVAYLQQAYILKQDEEELENIADKKTTGSSNSKITIIEGEVVEPKKSSSKTKTAKKSSKATKKRRK